MSPSRKSESISASSLALSFGVCKYATMKVCKSLRVDGYASMQNYANFQICKGGNDRNNAKLIMNCTFSPFVTYPKQQTLLIELQHLGYHQYSLKNLQNVGGNFSRN